MYQLEALMPFLIPIVGMTIPIIAIAGYFLTRNADSRRLHETLRSYTERGQQPPQELVDALARLDGDANRPAAAPSRTGAYTLIALGLSAGVVLWALRPSSMLWTVSLVLLAIGVARLLAMHADARARERSDARALPPQ